MKAAFQARRIESRSPHTSYRYSYLRAVTGLILVARNAGRSPDTRATNKNKVITPA